MSPRLQDLLTNQEKYLQYAGGCGLCPRKLQDYVPPTLDETRVIGVGEAPGANEVVTGRGFTGKSGDTLRATLQEFGILDQFSFTNTIHCRPPDNRQPSDKEISCCMNQHITGEVSKYQYVVLIGSVAQDAFFPGRAKVMKGNLAYHPDYPNTRFYGIYHPAAIGYNPSLKVEFRAQVERFARILRGEKPTFRNVVGEEFRAKFEQMLSVARLLSFDIETNGKPNWDPGFQIDSFAALPLVGDDVFAVHKDEPHWNWALDQIVIFLSNPENQVLGQNLGFDLSSMERVKRFQVNVKHIHDIQALYYELDQELQVGLKPLVSERLDGYRHLCPAPEREKNPERLLLYNGEDTVHPRNLFLRDFPRLKPKTQDLYLRVTSPMSLGCARITQAGIHFRSEIWDELSKQFEDERKKEIAEWAAEDPSFIPGKYVSRTGFTGLESYLYDVKKYPVIRMTSDKEDAHRATDESVIKDLIRQGHKELIHLVNLRGINTRKSTFIEPFPKHVAQDHRIHASYHHTRAATGRLASSKPNMQNNPRVNEDDYDPKTETWRRHQIRHQFGAPPGCRMVNGDLSQIELRIAMSLANDPVGIQAYKDGKDLHRLLASIITKKPMDQITATERFYAKSGNFGMIYGGSWFTLQSYAMDTYNIEIPDDEAKRWASGFFGTYKHLEPWHVACRAFLRENKGYMEAPTGHWWFYKNWDSQDPEAKSHDERSAINMTCQGPGAHIMDYLILLVQKRFYQEKVTNRYLGTAPVVLTVHDSLACEPDEHDVDRAMKIIGECLQEVEAWISPWFKVPLVLDLEVSEVWDG